MKRRTIYLTVTCLVMLHSAKSQHVAASSALKFQSNLQSGILIGQKGSSPAPAINMVNGVQYKTWFGGIGLGLDYYGSKRSLPLFLSVQKELSLKYSKWFWYTGGGYNFPWLKDNQKMQFVMTDKAAGGLFYEAGGGYKFTLFSNARMGISAGYSYKALREKYVGWNMIACIVCTPQTAQITTYEFRRIALKLNWWLQ